MKKITLALLLALVALLATSCATFLANDIETVYITSAPSGATVYVDSKEKGVTPLKVDMDNDSDHQVLLTLEGYSPVQMRIGRKLSAGWLTLDILSGFTGLTFVPATVDALSGDWLVLDKDHVHLTLEKRN